MGKQKVPKYFNKEQSPCWCTACTLFTLSRGEGSVLRPQAAASLQDVQPWLQRASIGLVYYLYSSTQKRRDLRRSPRESSRFPMCRNRRSTSSFHIQLSRRNDRQLVLETERELCPQKSSRPHTLMHSLFSHPSHTHYIAIQLMQDATGVFSSPYKTHLSCPWDHML